ncbi:hypothetical protein [Laspinema palackyanum]|uniref:hypothetical protein n=1 Tax=Laspinema palackyanum TaxID=3231601 RepID=UPI00345CE4BC|nr:hypothetical protein [Laspinema sp. D2c]
MFVVTTCCRCSPVMASAITGTIGGLSIRLFGDWCDRLHWGVTGRSPSNAVTTASRYYKRFAHLPILF